MGAGSITSNVKSDKTLVVVKNGEEKIETGRKKMGAILGDFVEVGCNSVLNPGTILAAAAASTPPPASGARWKPITSTRIRITLSPALECYLPLAPEMSGKIILHIV